MNRHYLIKLSIVLLLLTGCTTKPAQRHRYVTEAIEAESLIQSGKHKQAAALYHNLANTKPLYQNEFTLLAISAYIKSGDSMAAQELALTLDPTLLSEEQDNLFKLLLAQISLSNGEAEHAIDQLNIIQVYKLYPEDQISFYQSLAFAYSLTGDLLQSTQARIQLTPLLDGWQQRYENQLVILNTLNLLPPQILTLQQPPAPDILGGWMALSIILKENKSLLNSVELQTTLDEWEQLFPEHPANADFLSTFLEGSKHSFKIPAAIAFLLPDSGRFSYAAEAIKNGFMAAYQQSPGFQPSFRFYDSTTDSAVNLYHQAVSEGAELIIGPLRKENIEELVLDTELTIPVLALNHIENLSRNNLFQFGLSPIDDAKQIAIKARQDGHNNALILTPTSNKGLRLANHLTNYWQQTTGTVLETQSYNPKENDYSQPIKALLNLDDSQYRYSRLQQFLATNIQYTERRRQDVDTILLSSNTKTARSLYPQIRFYRASHIPVYTTSEVYSGQPTPALDLDLNNITFCDIPWLFANAYPGILSKDSLRDLWQTLPNKYLRLHALGIDAFNILVHLDQLDTVPYSGATGILSLNMENRITRQLVCATFIDGNPVLQELIYDEDNKITSDDNYINLEDTFH